MNHGGFLRWMERLTPGAKVRRPSQATSAADAPATTESQLREDAATVRQITEGLQQLEDRVEQSEIVYTSNARGYLTPDEDDRVRKALLAYRNYRLALYEILLRLERYPGLKPAQLRLKAFLVAYVAAVTLYAKSLRLHELAGRSDLVRGKLNEPEAKFNLEPGFFDEVMAGYCSLRNYWSILRAFWFWITRRRSIRRLSHLEPEPWRWLEKAVVTQRRSTTAALNRVWRSKLKQGWKAFGRTAFRPVDRASYRVRSRVGGRFAGFWLQPDLHRPLDGKALTDLHARLQPGDILLTRAEGKLTASLLPGFWAHAAIYLGGQDRLAALGVEAIGSAEPDHGLGYVIEAVSPRVRVASLATSLDADHVLVLRPQLPADERQEALREALRHLHKEYDFEFDFNLSSRLVCTGLVYRTFQGRGGIEFGLIKRLGNFTLTGDDVVVQSLRMERRDIPCLPPAVLMLRRGQGWTLEDNPREIRACLDRIVTGWRPALA